MKIGNILLITFMLILSLNVVCADRFGNGWGTANDFGVPPFYQIEIDDEYNTLTSVYGDLRIPVYCDIDGDNGREFIYSEGNTIIMTDNATSESFNESIAYTITPYSRVLDLVCVDDSLSATDTDNKIIVIYDNSNGVTAKGLKYSGGVLVDTYTYFEDLPAVDYGMQTSLTCIDYLNEQFCIYGANYSSTTNSFIRLIKNNTDVSYNTILVNNSGSPFQITQPSIYDSVGGTISLKTQLSYDEYDDMLYVNRVSEFRYSYIVDFDSCFNLYDNCTIDYTSEVLRLDSLSAGGSVNRFGTGALGESATGQVYCYPYYRDQTNEYAYFSCYDGFTQVYSYTSGTNYASGSASGEAYGSVAVDYNGDGHRDVIMFNRERAMAYDTWNQAVLFNTNYGAFMPHSVMSDNANVYIIGYAHSPDNLSMLRISRTNSADYEMTDLQDISKTDQLILFGDITRDSYIEILGSSDTASTITYLTASISVDDIDVFNTSSYQGLYGFYSQDNCLGDVTIKAKECLVGNDCNYINNNLNIYVQEKLCSDCGGTETYKCGSYSVTLPQITCTNLSAGSTNIDIDLFTETNENYPAFEFNTFALDVFDGVEGSTCNVVGNIITQEDADEYIAPEVTTTDGEVDLNDPDTFVDNILESFFNTKSNKLKLIIGIIVIGLVLGGIWERTKGKATNLLYAIGVICALILNIAFGIFAKEIGILGIILCGVYIYTAIRGGTANQNNIN